jgi:hypothetical protein
MINILILIVLMLVFFILSIQTKIENFDIDKMSYKNFDINKPTIIIGSSQYINDHIDDLKRLKKTGKYQFIAHQGAWGFFEKKLGFYPDYLSVFDIAVPKNISNYDDIFKKKKLVKLIFYDCWKDYNKIKLLDSSVIRNKSKEEYNEFLKTKLNIENKIIIPTEYIGINDTQNYLWSYKCPEINKNHPKYKNKFLIYSCGRHIKDKLTLHILPLILFLNIKNVYIMGFDCKGSNWNSNSKRYITGKFDKNQLKLTLPPLVKEIKKNNINLFNLIEAKNTELHPYIQYKNIKELE